MSANMIDLRMTRPPDSLRPRTQMLKSSENVFERRELSSTAPAQLENQFVSNIEKVIKERRAAPEKRKKEKERTLFPHGIEAPPKSKAAFGDIAVDELKRVHGMILNFCKLEDGSFLTDVDLKQYALDSGQTITNTVVQELCTIQPSLTRLDLTDCKEVTDAGLWAIARHCPKLIHLVLSGCDRITNIGLRSLALRCSEIKSLNFNQCSLLDDISLTVLATGLIFFAPLLFGLIDAQIVF